MQVTFAHKILFMGLKKEQEKEYAKMLFLSQNQTQKEIAERVGVTEKTLTKWIAEGGWEKLKKSLLVTKANQLAMLYDQLEWQNIHIATRKVVYDVPEYMYKPFQEQNEKGEFVTKYPEFNPEDYPVKLGNVATPKEADGIAKITSAIKRLETETSIAEIVEVAMEFTEFVTPLDLALAKQITKLFDIFITSKMK